MAFDDMFRLSSHAVIFNADNEVLMLKESYGAFSWDYLVEHLNLVKPYMMPYIANVSRKWVCVLVKLA
jgi:hypothetical protein